MKKDLALLIFISCFSFSSKAQWVTIPDGNFISFLQDSFPSCMNGNQMDTTCPDILKFRFAFVDFMEITNLDGIQYFDSLTTLNCAGNSLNSLPKLPNGLINLNCHGNQLTDLPDLPVNLKELGCYDNHLTSLPVLPNNMADLECLWNPLHVLPILPDSLTYLNCEGDHLTTLPNLPENLKYLICNYNELNTLPQLPQNLTHIDCSDNQLTGLPSLPSSVVQMDCSRNDLVSLPSLPISLKELICYSNQLTHLPSLPDNLTYLECDFNKLVELPPLPDSLTYLNCGRNQLTILPSLPGNLQLFDCYDNQLVSLPPLPKSLNILDCANNQISIFPALNMDSICVIDCSWNNLDEIVRLPRAAKYLDLDHNPNLHCLPPIERIEEINIDLTGIHCLINYIQHPDYIAAIDTMPLCKIGDSSGCVTETINYDLILFPNPADEIVSIKLPESTNEILLYDLLGRKIFSINVEDKNEITLSLKNIASGFYYVSAVRNNHKVAVKQLVKM